MAETNKTEKATAKKKRDERRKGNAFQSREVISVAMLIVGFILVSRLGGFIMTQVKGLYLTDLDMMNGLYSLSVASCLLIMKDAMVVFFISTVPILIALALTGILMTGAQTGFLVSGELLRFKFSRINLIEGFKRLLSLRSLVQLAKSIVKVGGRPVGHLYQPERPYDRCAGHAEYKPGQ